MSPEQTVYVVDDDAQTRDSVCILVRSMGLRTESFSSAEEFLARYDKACPGCLVTDIRMIGMSGLELLDELNRRDIPLPVIMVTAYPRTAVVIRAIQSGAITLLEKPYHDEDLWDAIRKGLAEDKARRGDYERRQQIRLCFERLTAAERSVMFMMVQGKPTKVIAAELEISVRTVESRRSEIFAKMQVESVVELVRQVIEANLENASA